MVALEVVTVECPVNLRGRPEQLLMKHEAELISARFRPGDIIILLDEAGEHMGSRDLASFIRKTMNKGPKRIVFIIGGAWGLDDSLKAKANNMIALSRMTFSHQLVRLLFAEQLYRAFTIINGLPYHHD